MILIVHLLLLTVAAEAIQSREKQPFVLLILVSEYAQCAQCALHIVDEGKT